MAGERTGGWVSRGTVGRLKRLPSLDLESVHDFLSGFRVWVNRDLGRAAKARFEALLRAAGIEEGADVPIEAILEAVGDDPVVWTHLRASMSAKRHSHQTLLDAFHGHDRFLAELQEADRTGPGSLELDPELQVPQYARHEIHAQPGGYVGDAFAGHVYHYSTIGFYAGIGSDPDQLHRGLASSVPLPSDGVVQRILDLGCGPGQLTVALKERWPEARVSGIDVSGPMVRYAHLRAIELGCELHLAQRLAEDTRFPDNHFDLVTAYILFHEVPDEIAARIVREAYRITRPGGVFFPMDRTQNAGKGLSSYGKFLQWWDHRWNNEVWVLQYMASSLPDLLREAGFEVTMSEQKPSVGPSIIGVKPGGRS